MFLGIPVWIFYALGGLGGAAALGQATKKFRKPYLASAASGTGETLFPPAAGGDVVSRALVFVHNVRETGVLADKAKTSTDFAALAAEANEQKKAEEAQAHREVDKLINEWTKTGTDILLKSGIGIIAIPFFVAGSQLLRVAGHFQVWVIKALGLGGNGWTEEWQHDAEAHVQWFVDNGFPFPAFNPKFHTSPKGYVEGTFGLYSQHLEVDIGIPADQREAMFRMGKSFKAHVKDNPATLGMYTVVGNSPYGMDEVSGVVEPSDLIAGNYGPHAGDKMEGGLAAEFQSKYTIGTYLDLVISAIGTTTAQDMGVPFESWKKVVDAARVGFGLGLKDGWAPDPAGQPHVSPGVWAWSRARLEAEKAASALPKKGLPISLVVHPITGAYPSLPKWGM